VRDINPIHSYLHSTYFLENLKSDFVNILGTAKVTGKSQITIPKIVIGKFKLKKGDLVVFVEDERGVLLRKGEITIKEWRTKAEC
jgi:AbrB family looped-hinge helix DNA binding protein